MAGLPGQWINGLHQQPLPSEPQHWALSYLIISHCPDIACAKKPHLIEESGI